MPYRRRYRKRYSRRRSTLSTRSIYSRRSGLAQAGQIAALKKRINKVYKVCKPEIKNQYNAVGNFNFNNTIAGEVSHGFGDIGMATGSDVNDRVGDKVYIKTKYYLSFEYYNNSNTGYHNSESAGCQLRVIVGRYKTSQSSSDACPPANALIDDYSSSGVNYTLAVTAPLKQRVLDDYYIDQDKVYYLTTTKNQKIIKLSTKWYTRKFDSVGSNHSFCLVVCSGLHADTNFTEEVNYAVGRKIVFTDA